MPSGAKPINPPSLRHYNTVDAMTPSILYEDNHVIVAVKPQNMPTQADRSHDYDFLNCIKQYVKQKYGKPGEVYIGLVHRLDRPAGGVMVFARTSKAAARLSAQIKDGSFQKHYFAITTKTIPAQGTLCDFLLKDSRRNKTSVVAPETPGAKKAVLSYQIKEQQKRFTLLDITLQTGRPHQIRVQFSHIGAPLVGDSKYGGFPSDKLALWSYAVSFLHPTKKERLSFITPPPHAHPWDFFTLPYLPMEN
jgi:23S rRNA pseudouridine1911/1915/1917 synthase